MSTVELIREIKRLPADKRLFVIRQAIKYIQESGGKSLEKGAVALLGDYKNDKELTAFTSLDFEKFYEAK